MQPRLNAFELVPDIYKAMTGVEAAMRRSSLPRTTYELVKLRVSQINGCGYCVDMHARDLKASGESDERLWSVAAWREAPYFTDAERAALDLAEAATRLADNPNAVPDEVWQAAEKEYPQETLAALVMAIATINFWNRVGVTTRLVAGSHTH
ncbi:carboxymuconolactone decarboxylase family protein [Nonomuraea sp. NPDC050663]|uniref:carboxymuconolactone decarboxylase family protein n=1 Tax=Nonomuraea sp. NPDC050663 TaxID=3364370 RepID=UPI0037A008AC